jgi:hypothetical protein
MVARTGDNAGMAERCSDPVPRWMPPAFVLLALALVPWTVWLLVDLPDRELADHWSIAWAGFDIGLACFLGATGIALARRSPFSALLAAMTGALLLTDAWFDVLTSRGQDLAVALAMAACFELPLAGICLWVAFNVERVLADARPLLERAGLR